MGIYIIFGVFTLLSWIVNQVLQSKIEKYSKVFIESGLTGREVAEKMLHDHGIRNVQVRAVDGTLTDHYNPSDYTVNLSSIVYGSKSVAAAAIAAHECGHAVQHATAYQWLGLRSRLVPIVSFASQWMQWVLLAGILLIQIVPQLLLIGICLFATTTLFSIITLPVEINASMRAVAWLKKAGIVSNQTQPAAVDALKWAAYTYVIAALGSLATLLYYISIFMRRR